MAHVRRSFPRNKLIAGVVIIAMVGIGIGLLVGSRAATANVSSEAEAGSIISPASKVADSSAAGGNAVKFAAAPVQSGKCIGSAFTPGGPDPWGGCWPGPQNTGYPHGLAGDTRTPVTLTAYTGPVVIRSCGVVIDSKIVNEDILIQVGNGTKNKNTPCVTIKNSFVKGAIYQEESGWGPTVITDTEIQPQGLSFYENVGRNNMYTYRLNSHGSQGVIKCDANCETVDNWVHGMQLGGQYHYNSIGGNQGQNWLIEHNYTTCGDWESISTVSPPGNDAGCSGVIGFYSDFGPEDHITINKNYMESMFSNVTNGVNTINTQGGYCLNPGYYPGKPFPAPLNMTITNNYFGRGKNSKCGVFGPTNSLNKVGEVKGNVWENNRFTDGTIVQKEQEQ